MCGRWTSVCDQGLGDPLRTSLDSSRSSWVLQVVFDALGLLNDFVKQVVLARTDSGFREWATWLRENLGARPNAWLRLDFVPSSPFLDIKNKVAKTSHILVLRKAWMPYF